jgi:hypothetical protein
MISLKRVWLCCRLNVSKWIVSPRIYAVFFFSLIYIYMNTHGIAEYAALVGRPSSPWSFPFYVSQDIMVLVYGTITVLLFCDAPFSDGQTPYLLIRMRRVEWILGQILYTLLTSVIYTLCTVLLHILVLIPHVAFSTDWGAVLYTLSNDVNIALERGISMMPLSSSIMELFSAGEAMALSMLQYFLASSFIGMLIFCGNVLSGRTAGVFAAGAMVFFASFATGFGAFLFQSNVLIWFAPVTWVSMTFLNWGLDPAMPPAAYAYSILILCILICGVISVHTFCKRDVQIQTGRRS